MRRFLAIVVIGARKCLEWPNLIAPVLCVLGGLALGGTWYPHSEAPGTRLVEPNLAFFSTIAQVFPVLIVALFVEVASSIASLRERTRTSRHNVAMEREWSDYHREKMMLRTGTGLLWSALIGEGAALYAVGYGPTAFVGAVCLISLPVTAVMTLNLFIGRASPKKPDGPRPKS